MHALSSASIFSKNEALAQLHCLFKATCHIRTALFCTANECRYWRSPFVLHSFSSQRFSQPPNPGVSNPKGAGENR